MMSEFAAVGSGAALGAWLRWGFSIWLNPMHPSIPVGTLTANLIGGLLIGLFMALAEPLHLNHTHRLLIATGFLGGLTTFSTFSAEVVALLLEAKYAWAAGVAAVHLMGSLVMTAAGFTLVKAALGTPR